MTKQSRRKFSAEIKAMVAMEAIKNEKTIANAILDRLIHQSHRIELAGELLRKKRKMISLENN